jgi:ABC-type glutathione transport system ATPase component
MPELLAIEALDVMLGAKPILKKLSLKLAKGSTLGIVGESGSGKSMTALALMGLLPKVARISSGSIRFQSQELVGLPAEDYRNLRGAKISMVFQEPFTCLNPVQKVQDQVAEVLALHKGLDRTQALTEALAWLNRVGIPDAAAKGKQYPHQWSGGMRQRAMIAMAMACGPELLIADEPTTALDVTVQAQILALLKKMCAELGTTLVLISHDLGVIDFMAENVAVMKDGEVVEQGPKDQVFGAPQHAYTRSLVSSYLNWVGAA